MRQQRVLLCLVEAVDLVDEENGFISGALQAISCHGDDAADVGDIALHSAQALEAGFCRGRDDLREAGFAHAGGAVENNGTDAIGLDGAAQ